MTTWLKNSNWGFFSFLIKQWYFSISKWQKLCNQFIRLLVHLFIKVQLCPVIECLIIFLLMFPENHLFLVPSIASLHVKSLLRENKKEEVKLFLRSFMWSQGQMIALFTLTNEEIYAILAVISLLIIYYVRETPRLWQMTDWVAASTLSSGHCWRAHIYFLPGYFCHCFLCKETSKRYLISLSCVISKNTTRRIS